LFRYSIMILPMKSCAKWAKTLIMGQESIKPYLAPGPAGLCIYLTEIQLHRALPGILIPNGYKTMLSNYYLYGWDYNYLCMGGQ